MGSVISLIEDWCLYERKAHHNKIQQLEDRLSDCDDKIKELVELIF